MWVFMSPTLLWQHRFEFDAKTPFPQTPKNKEEWMIGYVQNVLSSLVSIEYYDLEPDPKTNSAVKTYRASKSLLDAADAPEAVPYRPYLSAPWKLKADEAFRARAAARFQYGPNEIKLLPDLDQAKRNLGSPFAQEITFSDMPLLFVPEWFHGHPLKKVRYMHLFKFWVMAQSPDEQRIALVNSEPYSVVCVANFSRPSQYSPVQRLILDTAITLTGPEESYFVNGPLPGFPSAQPARKFTLPPIHPGEGSPRPIYVEPTAGKTLKEWLEKELELNKKKPSR